MARPARHDLAALEVVAIDRVHHLDHSSRDLLSSRVGFPPRVGAPGAGMTIAAAHAQGGRKESHRLHELVHRDALEHLNIFEGLLRHLRPRGLTLRQGNAWEEWRST